MKDLKIMSTFSSKLSLYLPRPVCNTVKSVTNVLRIMKTNFELSTLIAFGMCLQMLAFLVLPGRVAVAPALLLLFYKFLYARPSNVADNWLVDERWVGKMSANVPNEDGTMPEKGAANGVVCFVVGAQINQ